MVYAPYTPTKLAPSGPPLGPFLEIMIMDLGLWACEASGIRAGVRSGVCLGACVGACA
jgi:hypothetical protein